MKNSVMLTLLLASVACNGESLESGASVAELTTDKPIYRVAQLSSREASVTVAVRFKNFSDKGAYLTRCNMQSVTPAYAVYKAGTLERDVLLEGGQEQACPSGVPSFFVGGYQERVDTLHIVFDRTSTSNKSGKYLIVYAVRTSEELFESGTKAFTNVFEIVDE